MDMDIVPVPTAQRKQDIGWSHCTTIKIGDKVQMKCIYCENILIGGGIHRFKKHLAGIKNSGTTIYDKVPSDVCNLMSDSLNAKPKIHNKKLSEQLSSKDRDRSFGRFLFHVGADLEAVKSVTAGQGIGVPTYDDLWGWILKEWIEETSIKDTYPSTFPQLQCS